MTDRGVIGANGGCGLLRGGCERRKMGKRKQIGATSSFEQ
jgi:hypothetical protein